jgi:hypothetical protein
LADASAEADGLVADGLAVEGVVASADVDGAADGAAASWFDMEPLGAGLSGAILVWSLWDGVSALFCEVSCPVCA